MITVTLSIREMTQDKFELESMENLNIDPMDLRMSSKAWEEKELLS
jgi:hypothetical protein